MVLAVTNRVRPLLVIIFLLSSVNSTVRTSVTGRSCVACSVLAVSASDAVLRVCFQCFMVPQFVMVLVIL